MLRKPSTLPLQALLLRNQHPPSARHRDPQTPRSLARTDCGIDKKPKPGSMHSYPYLGGLLWANQSKVPRGDLFQAANAAAAAAAKQVSNI